MADIASSHRNQTKLLQLVRAKKEGTRVIPVRCHHDTTSTLLLKHQTGYKALFAELAPLSASCTGDTSGSFLFSVPRASNCGAIRGKRWREDRYSGSVSAARTASNLYLSTPRSCPVSYQATFFVNGFFESSPTFICVLCFHLSHCHAKMHCCERGNNPSTLFMMIDVVL